MKRTRVEFCRGHISTSVPGTGDSICADWVMSHVNEDMRSDLARRHKKAAFVNKCDTSEFRQISHTRYFGDIANYVGGKV